MGWWYTAGLGALALLLVTAWLRRRYSHWRQLHVPEIRPWPVFGNMLPAMLQRTSFVQLFQQHYNTFKARGEKLGGVYALLTPIILITDPELIKEITVRSFDYFSDRNALASETTDPLAARALVSLQGTEWREMRNLLSPAFTTGKLRAMFPLIARCGKQFARFLVTRPQAHTEPLEFKATFTRYTNDVIATVAFGVECNAVNDPEEPFYQHGQRIMDLSIKRMIFVLIYSMMPKVMEFFKVPVMSNEVTDFFRGIIGDAVKHRENNKVYLYCYCSIKWCLYYNERLRGSLQSRPDMLQLLIEAQKGGIKQDDEQEGGMVGEDDQAAHLHKKHLQTDKTSNKVITDDDIAAQAFLFFLAGFETESVLLSFMAHELAVNPDIQERLRAEVDAAILENNGQLTYESVQGMKYLDMVISETLRKFPPGGFSDRICTKDFQVPGSKIVLQKGTLITLPYFALHRDPEFFPDPDRFDPERFSEEKKGRIKPYTYLPFGCGPHNCIGMRLALLEAKVCMAYLVATCELRVSARTQVPLQLCRKSFMMNAEGGFWLSAVPRNRPALNVQDIIIK